VVEPLGDHGVRDPLGEHHRGHEVAAHLDHKDQRSTQIYAHLLPSAHERAIKRLTAVFEEAAAR
jgi:integrase